jgi:hypothetical protein
VFSVSAEARPSDRNPRDNLTGAGDDALHGGQFDGDKSRVSCGTDGALATASADNRNAMHSLVGMGRGVGCVPGADANIPHGAHS